MGEGTALIMGVVLIVCIALSVGYVLLKNNHTLSDAQNRLDLGATALHGRIDQLERETAHLRREVEQLKSHTPFDRHRIKALLCDHFDMSELGGVVFDLDLSVEQFRHQSKGELVEGLIAYCERHQRTGELVAVLQRTRPQLDWHSVR